MPKLSKAIAFDVDAASLTSLRHALSEWEIELVHGATADSLTRDWDLGDADLLLVGASGAEPETVALCRRLRTQSGRSVTLGSSAKMVSFLVG